jgi:hypothetical protein
MREKPNKYTNHSFSLLIMYGSSYMFRHYIAIFRTFLRFLCVIRGQGMNQIRFIHSVVCLHDKPKALPKLVLHTARTTTSSFNFHYPLFYLQSSSNNLRLLPCLRVTYFLPSIFPSIACFKKQILHKMWPIYSAFLYCMQDIPLIIHSIRQSITTIL